MRLTRNDVADGVMPSSLARWVRWRFNRWATTNGAFQLASDWDDITAGEYPALTAPGQGDTVSFYETGGTITGNGSVGPLTIEPGATAPWIFTGQITTPSGSIENTTSFTSGALLTVTGNTNTNGYLPYGMTFNAPVTLDDATFASAAATLSVGAGYSPLDPAGSSLTLQGGSAGAVLGASIGQGASGTLTVTVSSTFSTIANSALNTTNGTSGYLTLGQQVTTNNVTTAGNGTLDVSSDGVVTVGTTLLVGLDAGSVGTANVTSGGAITVDNGLTVGAESGSRGAVTVGNGGILTLGGGFAYVGSQAGSTGTLTINAGGTFNTTVAPQTTNYLLNIGNQGPSGTTPGAVGTVTVQGQTALLNWNDNPVIIGEAGTGTLNVLDGGVAEFGVSSDANDASLSLGRAGTGTINVSGAGSELTLAGGFYAGRASGSSATINVTSGGTLTETSLGAGDGSSFGTGNTVNGVFSTGGAGTLNVNSGGTATIGGRLYFGSNGATGSATISDGTLNVADFLDLGVGTTATAGTGTLTVEDGGVVKNTGPAMTANFAFYLGNSTSTDGTAIVTGTNSLFDMGLNGAAIGYAGTGALTVSAGAKADSSSSNSTMISALLIGYQAGSVGTLTVTGAGSSYAASGYTAIGEAGNGTLVVDKGASFTGGQAASGDGTGANAPEAIAIGAGNSALNSSGAAKTPIYGGDGIVQILRASTLTSLGNLHIGYRGSSGSLLVDSGSLAKAAGVIYVGTGTDRAGGSGAVTVQGGATLESGGPHATGSGSVQLGSATGTTGAITVTGAGSLLNAGGDRIDVGIIGTGTLTVEAGGTATAGATLYSDAASEAGFSLGSQGGTGTATIDGAGSLLNVDGDLTIAGSLAPTGGTGLLTASHGGTIDGAGLTLWSGGIIDADTTSLIDLGTGGQSGAGLIIQAGAALTAHGGKIDGDVTNAGSLSNDGSLTMLGNLQGPGTLTLDGGSNTDISGIVTGNVAFTAASAALKLHQLAGTITVTAAQAGDTIDLADITGATLSGNTVTAGSGRIVITGLAAGPGLALSSDKAGGTLVSLDSMPCFCSGTLIKTAKGDVPVEALGVGDGVVTDSGAVLPVRWIGWRRVNLQRHPARASVQPVRIAKDAFGPGRPARDLFISPEHAVFVDGVLIPARHLVGCRGIAADTALTGTTYYHIELSQHAVLLAEGLPCESWLDTGNRTMFENYAITDIHCSERPTAVEAWATQACAPLVTNGPALLAVRRRLGAAAAQTLKIDRPGLHRMVVAPDHGTVRLVSAPGRAAGDGRCLGAAVSALVLDGAAIALTDWRLVRGFHAAEMGWRWTDGEANLELGSGQHDRELLVEVSALAPPPSLASTAPQSASD